MQCVILAGGMATRLGSLTSGTPKALLPIAGRPFADHQLAWLASQGVTDVIYAIGHLGGRIRTFIGDGERWGLRVRYSDEGNELMGTAGALRLAHHGGLLEPAFGVLYGDSYLRAPLSPVWRTFDVLRPAALMTVYRNEGRFDRSNARLLDGYVVLYEKGLSDPALAGMHHIDYGYSIINRDAVMPFIEPGRVMDLSSVFHMLSKKHLLCGFEVTDRFYEIGSLEGMAELEELLSGVK